MIGWLTAASWQAVRDTLIWVQRTWSGGLGAREGREGRGMRETGIAVLLLVLARAPATGAELTATFIGNMGFHITDGKVAILTDFPYDPGEHFMRWSAEQVPKGPPAPLCLITHGHRDHFARELVSQFCGQVLGPKDVVDGAGVGSIAVSPEVQWKGVVIRPIATPHADLEHYSYLVEWHGLRLFFTGDTNDPAALLAAQDLDAAFVSPWLLQTLQQKASPTMTSQSNSTPEWPTS